MSAAGPGIERKARSRHGGEDLQREPDPGRPPGRSGWPPKFKCGEEDLPSSRARPARSFRAASGALGASCASRSPARDAPSVARCARKRMEAIISAAVRRRALQVLFAACPQTKKGLTNKLSLVGPFYYSRMDDSSHEASVELRR